ncbi:PH domain-containing protein [Pseudozyma hubeiensis]|nr:PH domain-containing protein [Pseudozyma hubeiensis]
MSEPNASAGSTSALTSATPPSSTAAILGASTNGWSPLRTSKRGSTVSYSQASPEHTNEDHPSLHSPKKQTQNFKALRGHGLVSNSIFKQIDGGSQPSSLTNSPLGSPSRRQLPSPSFGLGIGISNSPKAVQQSLKHDASPLAQDAENSDPFNLYATVPAAKGPQRKIPRKSLGRLHESNYVSNSVFRQHNGNADQVSSPPLTPTRAAVQQPNPSSPASASKGLLVSNRLHGPRFMSGSPQASHEDRGSRTESASPLRRERRKTVTFDEILDVQEFDKESSFDADSVYDDNEGHATVSQDADFWMSDNAAATAKSSAPQLHVVNADDAQISSDEAPDLISGESEPDLSNDSNETSSVEGPPSPIPGDASLQLQDLSVEHDAAAAPSCDDERGSVPERENSFARLSAADRVDSMMDELLRNDILNSPSVRARQLEASSRDVHEPLSAQIETVADPPRPDQAALPQLPAWTPISLDVDVPSSSLGDMGRSSTQPMAAQASSPIPPPTTRNGSLRGRPHISRDAILQRVAKEKLAREQAMSQTDSVDAHGRPALDVRTNDSPALKLSTLQQRRMPRGSEPGPIISTTQDAAVSHPKNLSAGRPSAPLRLSPTAVIATETKPIPPPSPVKELDQLASPLDLLGTELKVKADLDEPVTQRVKPSASASELPFFGSTESHSEGRLFPDMPQESSDREERNGLAPPATHLTPAQQADQIIARRRSKNGKARRKRSMSTSDARATFTAAAADTSDVDTASTSTTTNSNSEGDDVPVELPTRQSISADLVKSKAALDVSLQRAIDGGFQTNMEKELLRIYEKVDSNYNVNDRGAFKGIDDKVTHSTAAGDVDSGKAWKKLRRPSDINEYKKEMREFREGSNTRKAAGKVFVMVDSFTPTDLPVPSRPTSFHCILDNGLHMVKTATVPLRAGRGATSTIGQEFELIQHKNLEFSLTLVVQRDAHLVEPQRPPSPTRREHGSPTLKGLSRLFSSPKKQAARREQQEREAAAEFAHQASRVEPMLAYINREGAFGRTGVLFERVASQCYARCMVLDLPVHGVSNPTGSISGPSSVASRSHVSMLSQDFRQNLSKVRGTLRLKLFFLPPLPSIPRDGLPENLGECLRGMQNAAWHRSQPWQTGTLTQLGGDCASWRRRPVQAQGQHLICYNAVTKKPTVKIDLSKAVCIEEVGNHVNAGSMIFPSGASQALGRSRTMASYATTATLAEEEDADANYHVERSFRITFADGERISFFADTEAEKSQWVKVISDIIESEVPPNPLWAQALLEEMGAQTSGSINNGGRKPSQQMLHSRKAVPTVPEEVEASPAVSTPTPSRRPEAADLDHASRISHHSTASQSSTPSRLPIRAPHNVAASSPTSERGSMRGAPMAPRPASMIRTPVHDTSNRAAFDRLKRAGHARAQTEDLTPLRRR